MFHSDERVNAIQCHFVLPETLSSTQLQTFKRSIGESSPSFRHGRTLMHYSQLNVVSNRLRM